MSELERMREQYRVNRDPEGKKLQSIRPGMIKYLAPGEEVQTANPSRGMANARDYISIQERLAGAGLGLSYELMSRDFNKASFSSARQGMIFHVTCSSKPVRSTRHWVYSYI